MVSDRIELTTIDANITRSICIEQCGAKCCDFAINDYAVKLSPEDYRQLAENDLDEFVTFQRDESGIPQLVNKPDGTCIFLHPSKQCSIYPLRPASCRIYPYQDEMGAIPNWCLLYHNSSEELKQQQQQQSYKAYDPQEEGVAYKNYNKWKIKGDTFITRQMKQQVTLDGSNQFWIIFSSLSVDKRTIRSRIQQLKKTYSDKNWHVFSVRFYSDKSEFIFQANGITRENYRVSIPFINHFPPDPKDVLYLLQETEHNPELEDHLVAGIDLPSEVIDGWLHKFG